MPSVLLQIFISLRTSQYSLCSGLTRSRLDAVLCLIDIEGHGIVPHNCSEDCPLKSADRQASEHRQSLRRIVSAPIKRMPGADRTHANV